MPFFIIFIGIPLIEIGVFMTVGGHIGIGTTLLLALLTAIIGGAIIKHQGLHLLQDIKLALDSGKIPLTELFDGICLLIAGATLITPGFVTDGIGFLLLIPPFRSLMRNLIKNHTNWYAEVNQYGNASYTAPRDPDIIEGEIIEDTPGKQDEP